jgi:DNA-binding MarR family transcriptional regulator
MMLLDRFSIDVTRVAAAALGQRRNQEIQSMLVIHFRPGITPGGLAAATGLRQTSVSRSLAHLTDDGVITRTPAPFDGRSANLRLSRKGHARMARFERRLADYLADSRPAVRQALELLNVDAPDEEPPVSALDVMLALTRVGAAYVEQASAALSEFGVEDEPARYALTLIRARKSVRPTDLAGYLLLSTSGVSDLLDRMEAAALIRREHADMTDRRAVQVTLTPTGDRAAKAKATIFARHSAAIVRALSLSLHTTTTRTATVTVTVTVTVTA